MLSKPLDRVIAHTRNLEFHGFARNDGLWDVDCRLIDTKQYSFIPDREVLIPGDPVHDMEVRLTLNDDFNVIDVETCMNATPFDECVAASINVKNLIGMHVGSGWRKAVETAMGGICGCTHLREMMYSAATVAYQTIPSYRVMRGDISDLKSSGADNPPFYVGKCMALDRNGAVIKRIAPQFAKSDILKNEQGS